MKRFMVLTSIASLFAASASFGANNENFCPPSSSEVLVSQANDNFAMLFVYSNSEAKKLYDGMIKVPAVDISVKGSPQGSQLMRKTPLLTCFRSELDSCVIYTCQVAFDQLQSGANDGQVP
jgi:hypothetical protein